MVFCLSGSDATVFRMSSRVSFKVQADAGSSPSGVMSPGSLGSFLPILWRSPPPGANFLLSRLKFRHRLTVIR